jgi:hypothetical protein
MTFTLPMSRHVLLSLVRSSRTEQVWEYLSLAPGTLTTRPLQGTGKKLAILLNCESEQKRNKVFGSLITVLLSMDETMDEYRAVSGAFRTIDPPPPLHPASVSYPRIKGGGIHTRRAVRGWGRVQYFGRRQTLDWPLTLN